MRGLYPCAAPTGIKRAGTGLETPLPAARARAYSERSSAPSSASRRVFVRTPPGAENPVILSLADTTLWHGTRSGHGFLASATPTARADSGPSAIALATSP